MYKLFSFFTLFFLVIFHSNLKAEEVKVAVAANFSAPMKEISALFENQTGHKILLSFGSTGNFYTQIKNGAPFDILLAADSATIDKLSQEALTVKNTEFCYAQGKLVLWSFKDSFIKDKDGNVDFLKYKHIAIADPNLAPYGLAAKETLENLGLWMQLNANKSLVEGKNITQAFQFVESANADIGFVAFSQIYKAGESIRGCFLEIPLNLYSPIKQYGAILKAGEKNQAAEELIKFLKAPESIKIIKNYGYLIN